MRRIFILFLSLLPAVALPAYAAVNSNLITAAGKGDMVTVKTLLGKGADANITDPDGKSALIWAAAGDYPQTVYALLKRGAAVNAKDNTGRTALMWVAWYGHFAVVDVLMEGGADLNIMDSNADTAIMIALKRGNTRTATSLSGWEVPVKPQKRVEAELIIKAPEPDSTPVQPYLPITKPLQPKQNKISADHPSSNWLGMVIVVAALLVVIGRLAWARHKTKSRPVPGTNIKVKDKAGLTPLMYAAMNGHTDIVRILLDKGADVNECSRDGKTALLLAAIGGHQDTVIMLMNCDDKKPTDKPDRHNHPNIVELFKKTETG